MDTPVLELKNICKNIKGREIVKNVNFSVNKAEVFGFLGPNGAGKTTTIRMIVGLIKPTSGEIFISGNSFSKDYNKALKSVGCIIESPDLYKYMSGMDNLLQFQAMDNRITGARIHEVVELVGLQNRVYDKVGTYSLGMRQRLGIAQALLNKPKLLILDEPTNGLDPAGISEFRQLIRKLAYEEEMSVFVSSHLLLEVQQMCDKVAIISKGSIVKSLKVEDIKTEETVEWNLDNPKKAIELLLSRWDIKSSNIKKNLVRASIGNTPIEEINHAFFEEDIEIKYCFPRGNSLEDLFLNLTEGDEIV